jgi:hypothetical protein
MKNRLIIIVILLSTCLLFSSDIQELKDRFTGIQGQYTNGKVALEFSISDDVLCDSIAVYRSYNTIEIPIDTYKLPISKKLIYATNKFTDSDIADNISYYYLAVGYFNNEAWAISDNLMISIPQKELATGDLSYKDIHIEVDKENYFLQLLANKNEVLKKYPLAMGENPFSRKTMRDRVSSPEGIYQVVYILKNATNYKALDINYPNTIDRVRFELSKDLDLIPQKEYIGGDIQIHGMGINTNWTLGSFALRNEDIDEIIDSNLVKPGTKIIITGYEIGKDDIAYLDRFWTKAEIKIIQNKLRALGYDISSDGVLGPNSRKVLGNFQYKNALKVTCELDRETCHKIGYIPYDVKP